MKVLVTIDKEISETQVEIKCSELSEDIKDLERMISLHVFAISGKQEGRFYPLHPRHIYYFDAMDHKVFAYTKDEVYEVSYKLYQLEEMFAQYFLRVNKNTLVNPRVIKSFQSSINGRMEAQLLNQDKLVISRMYVANLKAMLKGDKR
jgi:DNA-binding LytR/AlgR family response regulator